MENLWSQITEEYMPMLLNWAWKKTGDKDKAEDLTQEVLLQVLSAAQKSTAPIAEPEHFLWKIAHYTWCNYLRAKEHKNVCVSMENLQLEDSSDFAAEFAEEEYRKELTRQMRRQISKLSLLQRDILISFYIEGQSVQNIAQKKNMAQSTVKWHLFQTRKKLKKEITTMTNNNYSDYVYRPRTLQMALSGLVPSMESSDINLITNSLTKQNICIICYRQPRTMEQLSELLGLPMAYVESDLEWLVEHEFIAKSGSGYVTSFLITSAADEQGKYAVIKNHREKLSDVILRELAASEDAIRSIGFCGSDKPFDRLLWMLVYQFCRSMHIPYPDLPRTARMDGGNYLPLGFDRTDWETVPKAVDTAGWSYNGSMQNGSFCWFGMYNFGRSAIEELINGNTLEAEKLRALLEELIHNDYSVDGFDEQKKYLLAQLVQQGYVTLRDSRAIPNFCVFTKEQFRRLSEDIFAPIADKLKNELPGLVAELEACCKTQLPEQLKDLFHASVAFGLHAIGYITTIFAFEKGMLYKPEDSHDGEFLTLVYMG